MTMGPGRGEKRTKLECGESLDFVQLSIKRAEGHDLIQAVRERLLGVELME